MTNNIMANANIIETVCTLINPEVPTPAIEEAVALLVKALEVRDAIEEVEFNEEVIIHYMTGSESMSRHEALEMLARRNQLMQKAEDGMRRVDAQAAKLELKLALDEMLGKPVK